MSSAASKFDLGGIVALGLRWAGWLSCNILVSLGLFVVAFLAIGGFSMFGLMFHLDNLAQRYVAASFDRQAQFNLILAIAFVLFFFMTAFFRRHGSPFYRKDI